MLSVEESSERAIISDRTTVVEVADWFINRKITSEEIDQHIVNRIVIILENSGDKETLTSLFERSKKIGIISTSSLLYFYNHQKEIIENEFAKSLRGIDLNIINSINQFKRKKFPLLTEYFDMEDAALKSKIETCRDNIAQDKWRGRVHNSINKL